MYIHTPAPKQRCSKCGAIDNFEIVTKPILNGQKKIRKCTSCGHKKTISTTTWTPPDGHPHVYKMKPRPEIEDF
jgi:uncharacterized Zn finger protein